MQKLRRKCEKEDVISEKPLLVVHAGRREELIYIYSWEISRKLDNVLCRWDGNCRTTTLDSLINKLSEVGLIGIILVFFVFILIDSAME